MKKPENPLIGVVGPADTMSHCAQVLQIVDLATGADADAYDRDDAAMGYYLILRTVREALKWEAEHLHERTGRQPPTEHLAGVSQLQADT